VRGYELPSLAGRERKLAAQAHHVLAKTLTNFLILELSFKILFFNN
jgi:hypothetical protein